MTGLAQDAFDDGKIALLSDGAACNIQTLKQKAFFTGKAHSDFPFLINYKDIYINR